MAKPKPDTATHEDEKILVGLLKLVAQKRVDEAIERVKSLPAGSLSDPVFLGAVAHAIIRYPQNEAERAKAAKRVVELYLARYQDSSAIGAFLAPMAHENEYEIAHAALAEGVMSRMQERVQASERPASTRRKAGL